MTLTFNTHLLSIICLHVSSFRSQADILSEKSTVFTFSYRIAYVTKFDLDLIYAKVNYHKVGVNQVKVNPRSSFV